MTELRTPELAVSSTFRVSRKVASQARSRHLGFVDELPRLAEFGGRHVRASAGMSRIDIVPDEETELLRQQHPAITEESIRRQVYDIQGSRLTTLDEFMTFKLGQVSTFDLWGGRKAVGVPVIDDDATLAGERQELAGCFSVAANTEIILSRTAFYLLLAVCDKRAGNLEPMVEYAASRSPDEIYMFDAKVRHVDPWRRTTAPAL